MSRAADYVGAQAELVVAEIGESVTALQTRQDIATLISYELPTLDASQFTEAMSQFLVACHLAGRVAVAIKTRREANSPGAYDQMFAEAVEALRGRIVLTPEEFLRLETKARSRAGRVAGELNLRIVQDIYDVAVKTLESGGTLRDFRLAVNTLPGRGGWSGSDPWHANLVMSQNAAMSYNAGSLEQADEIGATAWTFEGYQDSCPICAPMIGKTFDMADTDWFPPVHFNCDCWVSYHYGEKETVEPSRIVNPAYEESQRQRGAFRYDPREFSKSGPFSLASVPKELKPAFRRHAAQEGWEIVE